MLPNLLPEAAAATYFLKFVEKHILKYEALNHGTHLENIFYYISLSLTVLWSVRQEHNIKHKFHLANLYVCHFVVILCLALYHLPWRYII